MAFFQFKPQFESTYHVSWYIVAYKFLFGFVEFFSGISILFFGHQALYWYQHLVRRELVEDPHDLAVRILESVVPGLLMHNTFLAFYLVLLGTAKMVGAVGLIYRQHWGVDLLVGLTFLMLPFQLASLILHPSFASFLYITGGLLIVLYLINFQPKEWAKRVSTHVKKQITKAG